MNPLLLNFPEVKISVVFICNYHVPITIFVEMLKQRCAITRVKIFEESHIAKPPPQGDLPDGLLRL